jgi:hypothetical protein
MERKQPVGTKDMPELDNALDANQEVMVDELITPHVKMPERGGAIHKIVASYPAQEQERQPTQARGHVVWSDAYSFQRRGPSYLDPIENPGALSDAR